MNTYFYKISYCGCQNPSLGIVQAETESDAFQKVDATTWGFVEISTPEFKDGIAAFEVEDQADDDDDDGPVLDGEDFPIFEFEEGEDLDTPVSYITSEGETAE